MTERKKSDFVGAFVPEALAKAFKEEAANVRGEQTAILEELLRKRYGQGATAPAMRSVQRRLAAALAKIQEEAPDLAQDLLTIAAGALERKNRRLVHAFALVLSQLSADEGSRAPQRSGGERRRANRDGDGASAGSKGTG